MTVRPEFNITKEQWSAFKKVLPDFGSVLEKFASESASDPIPIARNQFLLNLLTEDDLDTLIYFLNRRLTTPLEPSKIEKLSSIYRHHNERSQTKKFLKDMEEGKLRKLPPINSGSLKTIIESVLWATENSETLSWDKNRPRDFETSSMYEAMELIEWFKRDGIKYSFSYLPEDNMNSYLISIL